MHYYLYEPRAKHLQGLLAELDDSDLDPVSVSEDFFEREFDLAESDGSSDRPILLSENPKTLDYIASLRQSGCRNPILVLRDERDPEAAMAALDAGADDDVVRPLSGAELRARVNAIKRRFHGHAAGSVQIGDITAYFDGRDPDVAGEPMKLSQRELAIFQQIALASPRVVSKSVIYDAVYGMAEEQPFDKVIDVYICRIRKKIEEMSPASDPHIRTIRGRGYQLVPQDKPEIARIALRQRMPASAQVVQEAQL
ncbi:transcriptional regulator [Oceanicola sp. 22II-s10i]|uniref:response regulator transcription factor n=1 Tax=Oceanicola sp. 22II-s10i TaxID=1317116 RepID=UPI000B657B6C|nr:response regulator transcription factor [Oceanicola sp. 22II-s10i]OWU83194.1 transcriptional regulator [Oceanicola sp. 22II-s10i]